MSAKKGLDSLRRWKKCQQRISNATFKAAMRGVPKKLKRAKSAAIRAKANVLASEACSKGGARRAKKTSRRSRAAFTPVIPDFARQHAPPRPYEAPFNPETSY